MNDGWSEVSAHLLVRSGAVLLLLLRSIQLRRVVRRDLQDGVKDDGAHLLATIVYLSSVVQRIQIVLSAAHVCLVTRSGDLTLSGETRDSRNVLFSAPRVSSLDESQRPGSRRDGQR